MDQPLSRAKWKPIARKRSAADRDKILSDLGPNASKAPEDSELPEWYQEFQQDVRDGKDWVTTQKVVEEEERLEDLKSGLSRKRSEPVPVSSFQKRELSLVYSRGLWGGGEL